MKFWLGIIEGLREIRAHKFRSFLTMLGVVLGVASLLAMFALTAGMAAGFQDMLTQIGGLERVGIVDAPVPAHQELLKENSRGRTYRDVAAIRKMAPLIRSVSPELSMHTRISAGARTSNVRVTGAENPYFSIERHTIAAGRAFADLDYAEANPVCVIGWQIAMDLFKKPEPIGEKIRIQGILFTVIGVFERYETESQKRARDLGLPQTPMGPNRRRGGAWDPLRMKNTSVVIPFSTFASFFRSANMVGTVDQGPQERLDGLNVEVQDVSLFDEALEQLRGVLGHTHKGIEDFAFDTRESWFESAQRASRNARVSGGVIAGISLVVGAIGICNIMLASITERIREIGIRRAIGARALDVFVQIIVESSVLATLGGLLGLLFTWVLLRALVAFVPPDNAPIVEPFAVAFSLGAAVLSGMIAGIYPAWKASKLNPIEALRYD